MRIIACKSCHAQYDVSDYGWERFSCGCGSTVQIQTQVPAQRIEVHNCGACGAPMPSDADACPYCRAAVEYDQRKLNLICPECYARNPDSSKFCRNCAVAFRPEHLTEQRDGLACPVCTITMKRRSVVGHPADECPKCGGLWIGKDYFAEMVNRSIAKRKKQLGENFLVEPAGKGRQALDGKVTYRPCPVCTKVMNRKNFERVSGVIIDECRDDGIWLDADELEQIAAFVAAGGLAKGAEFERRHGMDKQAAFDAMPKLSGGMGGGAWSTDLTGRSRLSAQGQLMEAIGGTLVDVLEGLFRRL